MYIQQIAHYLPKERLSNAYFEQKYGFEEGWLEARTGIRERTKATEHETTNSMAIEVARKLVVDKDKLDLIVGGSYTPSDTIFSIGHAIQRDLDIERHFPVVYISSAVLLCSTLWKLYRGILP